MKTQHRRIKVNGGSPTNANREFDSGKRMPELDAFRPISRRTALKLVDSRNPYERRTGFGALSRNSEDLRRLARVSKYADVRMKSVETLKRERKEAELMSVMKRCRYEDVKNAATSAYFDLKGAMGIRPIAISAEMCRAAGLIE